MSKHPLISVVTNVNSSRAENHQPKLLFLQTSNNMLVRKWLITLLYPLFMLVVSYILSINFWWWSSKINICSELSEDIWKEESVLLLDIYQNFVMEIEILDFVLYKLGLSISITKKAFLMFLSRTAVRFMCPRISAWCQLSSFCSFVRCWGRRECSFVFGQALLFLVAILLLRCPKAFHSHAKDEKEHCY